MQIELGEGDFKVTVPAIFPHLIKRCPIDQRVLCRLRVNDRPDERLVRVTLVKLVHEDDVSRLGNLLDVKVRWRVQLVLTHHDLPVEDDYNLVVGRNDDQVLLLLLDNLNLVNVIFLDLVGRNAPQERKHLEVLAQVVQSLLCFHVRLWL